MPTPNATSRPPPTPTTIPTIDPLEIELLDDGDAGLMTKELGTAVSEVPANKIVYPVSTIRVCRADTLLLSTERSTTMLPDATELMMTEPGDASR